MTDALFGKPRHSLEVLSEQDITITMPEGKYPAHVKRERRTWKRARWFTPLVREYWDVDVEGGIPVPGKGENTWDCDDDAIFASRFSVNKAETAYMAGKCVAMDALRPAIGTRALVGYRWRPNLAAPISCEAARTERGMPAPR